MKKILIADKLPETVIKIFHDSGLVVEEKTGLTKDELSQIIGDYNAVIVRSATKITPKVIAKAKNLKVVGRAGIGVDNIDMLAATEAGIIVMNTPYGNAVTTAEHTIAMIMALVRKISHAHKSLQSQKWEKNKFVGIELEGKKLGIIGCGNIGSLVAKKAIALEMKVMAYDPFLLDEKAKKLGVEKCSLHDLLTQSDIISLHTPLTEKTRNILNKESLALCKKGAFIINCARGGLIDEAALLELLENQHLAGAALDVYQQEPVTDSAFFKRDDCVCTPHLAASTTEAQEKVAHQIARQIIAYLTSGAVENALNSPSITAQEAPILKPFINLSMMLGEFCGQIIQSPVKKISIEYQGELTEYNIKPLTSSLIAGLLRFTLPDINVVSAPHVARKRGIYIEEILSDKAGIYDKYIELTIETENSTHKIAGTVFSDKRPRIIHINGVNMDAVFSKYMLYINNVDKVGFIGGLGTLLAKKNINIATFNLGRDMPGGNAIALINIDSEITKDQMKDIEDLEHVKRVEALNFLHYVS